MGRVADKRQGSGQKGCGKNRRDIVFVQSDYRRNENLRRGMMGVLGRKKIKVFCGCDKTDLKHVIRDLRDLQSGVLMTDKENVAMNIAIWAIVAVIEAMDRGGKIKLDSGEA